MKIEKNYRKSLLIAVIFHVVLLCFLIFDFAPSVFRAPPSGAPMKTIQAKAISEAAVYQTDQRHQQELARENAAVAHEKEIQIEQKRQQELARASAASKAAAEKAATEKAAAEKAAAEKALVRAQAIKAKQKRQQALARASAASKAAVEKAAAEKAAAEKAAAEKALARAQAVKAKQKRQQALARARVASKLAAEQKKLQQEMIQQQINSETKNISQIQTKMQQQGEINKYKAEILALIQSNWRIDQVNDKLKCIYDVSVAPDGTILSVTLKQSSGSDNLDESARQAIMASSPLPVPQSAVLFNHFRQLVLTLSPQGILQSVGTA